MQIHVLLGSLLGISLSTGTITSMVSKCAPKVVGTLETIKSMLIGSKVANFDETGADPIFNVESIRKNKIIEKEFSWQIIYLNGTIHPVLMKFTKFLLMT